MASELRHQNAEWADEWRGQRSGLQTDAEGQPAFLGGGENQEGE